LRKSSDELRLDSVFTYNLPWVIQPYAAGLLLTQFTKGFDYSGDQPVAISNFFDPGYITESVGATYAWQEFFKTRMRFAIKETITRDYPTLYTDDPDTAEIEKIKVEPGLESVTDLKIKLNGLLLVTSQLSLFSNMKATDQIVVRWENAATAALMQFVNVNFTLILVYDKNQSTRRQLSQGLALGLTYAVF
jgi:hypothetical protein